jgi:hypothetical protein
MKLPYAAALAAILITGPGFALKHEVGIDAKAGKVLEDSIER